MIRVFQLPPVMTDIGADWMPGTADSEAHYARNHTGPKGKSVRLIFRRALFLISLASILSIGCVWIFSVYFNFEEAAETMRREFEASRMELIRREVDRTVEYVEFMRSQAEKRLKRTIREQADEAYEVARSLYETYKDEKSAAEIQALIVTALRRERYDGGRGFFFIATLDGIGILQPATPDMEGKSILGLMDGQGNAIIKGLIEELRSEGDCYYEYKWLRPGEEGAFRKISYVRTFAPYNWYIGTGEYIRDVERDIQKEVVERVERIRFDNDGYIFIGNNEGVSQTAPAKGRNMYEATDVNGVKIVQELIKAANAGGGFVSYVMPPLEGARHTRKVSYAKGVPGWDWYVGAGIYVDDIEDVIDGRRRSMRAEVIQSSMLVVMVLCGAFLLARALSRRASQAFERDFTSFAAFFDAAAFRAARVSVGELGIEEFKAMAASANRMIDERWKSERETRRLRNLLKAIIDAMPSAVVGVDAACRVTQWNLEAERTTGLTASEALGKPLEEAFPGLGVEIGKALRAMEDGKHGEWRKLPFRANGVTRYRDVTVAPLLAEDGRGAVVRVDDVTQRARIEGIMVQTEKMMSVGGLAAGMAHEINNPLGIILGAVQNLERRLDPGFQKNRVVAGEVGLDMDRMAAYLERRGLSGIIEGMREAAARAARIVKNMLDFSRRGESRLAPFRADALLERAVELALNDYDMRKRFGFNGVRFIREYSLDLPLVPVAETEMEQVFLNLVKNAAQAMSGKAYEQGGPEIILRTVLDGDHVRIEVEDNGPGLDPETCQRVFEPFFTTKAPGDGTGLGLFVTYFIVTRNHGGTCAVESEPGQWTRFIIKLPLHPQGVA